MLKVVVADDETRVCKLVLMLADWGRLGMEVVGTASNGLEALELVHLHHPDILITDMRMPGLHGLELIQQAKAEQPRLEIVIISGYAHFEYAQSAIKHGVGDYLLKPIQKDELNATLEKLGARCRERSESASAVAHLRESRREDLDRLWDQLLGDLAEGSLKAPTAEVLRERYHVETGPGLFQMFLLKLDYETGAFSPASLDIVREKAEKLFRAAVPPLCHQMLLSFRPPWGRGFLNFPAKQRDGVRRALREALNQLAAQQSLFGPIEFSLAMGKAVSRPEELPESLRSAYDVAAERLVEGTGRLLENAPRPSALGEGKLLERYGRAAEHAAESLSPEEARAAAELLEAGAASASDARGRALLDLASSAGHLFVLRLGMEDREAVLREFDRDLGQCSRVPQLFARLRRLQDEQLALALQRRESEAIRPIRTAKQYIQQHYSQAITLEDVCAATGFSVSYFSAMFKKETGEGFSKYLTRVRIDRAKELLQQTDLSVADVCAQVGYGDLKHFTQTFKKVSGLSPAQYRKLYG